MFCPQYKSSDIVCELQYILFKGEHWWREIFEGEREARWEINLARLFFKISNPFYSNSTSDFPIFPPTVLLGPGEGTTLVRQRN